MVAFVLAIRPSSRRIIFLGIAIIGLVLGSAYLFKGEGLLPAVNPVLALVVSLLSAGFLWVIATKTLDVHLRQPTHDLGRLLGATGVARTEVHAEGTVFVNMEDWSAQSEAPIPAGDRVRVVGREGLVLTVESADAT
jgi:membrane-bound serine protease (ClpP class)